MVAGVPIGVPMLDIHTAGAGGGSIARFDAGGMLRVGPESAGAEPGPICFGRGTLATVTDANLLLGRLDSESFLGGGVQLDFKRTERMMQDLKGPLETVEEFAAGILEVVEMQMERAIRVISIERGHDPQECTLVAFGGGGPLHACSLARALRIPRVMIPAMPGALSAVGILLADAVRDYSRTVMLPGSAIENLEHAFEELEQRGTAEFAAENVEGIAQRTIDMRYQRQGYELNVVYEKQAPDRAIDAFHKLHLQRYGFCDVNRPTEIVNLRVRMTASAEPYAPVSRGTVPGDGRSACYAERAVFFDGKFLPTRLYRRNQLVPGDIIPGPAMISEYTSATVVPPGCIVNVDGYANLIVSIGASTNEQ
jgi:N-methylhydantoinase A